MKTFTEGDKEIISAIASLDLCDVELISHWLQRNEKSVARRLPFLLSQKLIYRLERGSTDRYIYSARDISRRSPFTLEHDLMISRIHSVFHREGLLGDPERWTQGRGAWSDVHPDAFCQLGTDRFIDLYIEADNATMNSREMSEKIGGYLKHYERNGQPFKVLFVTTSPKRAQNLAKLAQEAVSPKKRRLYLFTTFEALISDSRGQICHIPHDTALYPILPTIE